MQCAYCWGSGLIEFGYYVPTGALFIGRGGKAFRKRVEVYARHSRSGNGRLLVPGIPEAATEDDAFLALRLFIKLVRRKELTHPDVQAYRNAQDRSFNANGKRRS